MCSLESTPELQGKGQHRNKRWMLQRIEVCFFFCMHKTDKNPFMKCWHCMSDIDLQISLCLIIITAMQEHCTYVDSGFGYV